MNNHTSITQRTEEFAIRIIKACVFLDEKPGVTRTLGKQLIRSGTSIGANVHEAQSAQSTKDFINKLEIALKEARETEYWLRILIKSDLVPELRFKPLLEEVAQIKAIIAASVVKLKQKPS
jgi:four helix bundle protein